VSGRGAALAILREPNFRYYFISTLVDGAGTAMGSIALAFAVLEVSSSPSALGIVMASNSVPEVLLMLVGGVVADRLGRTRTIQASNVLAGFAQLAIAGLVIAGQAQIWQLAALSAVTGAASGLGYPALASVTPQLVTRDKLQPANLLSSMRRGVLNVIGPTIGGVLVVTVGAGWAVAINGITDLAAAAILLRVTIPPPLPRAGQPSMTSDLRAGWAYFRATTWLWVVVLALGLLNALHAAFNTLGPVVALSTDIGETGWGLVLSAGAAGLLATTVVMLWVPLPRPLLWGMLGCTLYGVPMVVLGVHPQLVWVMVATFVGGVGIEIFSLGWSLAMQEHVPDEMLARASSFDALGSFVAIPVGQLAVGPLGAAFGVRETLLVCGVSYVVICLATLGSRSVRDLQRVDQVVAS
jgi:MFS family permease